MVHIDSGKTFAYGGNDLIVISDSGDYNEEDLIECAIDTSDADGWFRKLFPTKPQSYCAFQAQFVAGQS
jgi:hypothetical protein